MKQERAQILFEAIGLVREETVEETQAALNRRRRPGLRRLAAVAACLLLVLAAGGIIRDLGLVGFPFFLPHGSKTGGGGNTGASYMSYMGPVLPLSAREGGEGLTVIRSTDFGFSNPKDRQLQCQITDEYVLTNPGQTAETVTLLYPFAAALSDEGRYFPTLLVDGEALEAELLTGPVTDGGTAEPVRSWEDYRRLLEKGPALLALRDPGLADLPVTVYEISGMYDDSGEKRSTSVLDLEFTADFSRTAILTYRFNGGSNDLESGLCHRHTDVRERMNPEWGESTFLLVLGEDIQGCEMKAWTSAALETPAERAGGTLRRYPSTLGEMLAGALETELRIFMSQNADASPYLSEDRLLGLTLARLEEQGLNPEHLEGYSDRSGGFLEDVFSVVLRHRRLMYARFTLTVPAGASVRVTAEFVKQPSIDFYGPGAYRNGYDLVTRLGSGLTFTKQEASLSGGEKLEIVDQNFGFDLKQGITRVTLDPEAEHYYLDVRLKS